jgi:hypothetical protein
VRRYVIALVAIFSMALAALGGGALGRSVRPAGPGRTVRAAVAHAARPAAVPESLGRRLNGRLHALRDGLAGALRPQRLPRRALSPSVQIPRETTCAVGLGRCSLHPCVEFAVLNMPQVIPAGPGVRRPKVAVASPRVSSCRSVPASGQTRLLRVTLTR